MIGMDAFHHEKQLHPLCCLLSGNRFIISIFTSPLIGSWTIDHAPGLAVRVWWCLGESRIKILISLRERWRVHPAVRSHNTCYDSQWHLWLTALSLLLRYHSVNSPDALSLLGTWDTFPFTAFLLFSSYFLTPNIKPSVRQDRIITV